MHNFRYRFSLNSINMDSQNLPLVSIGMPVYNVAPYVEKSVLSVLNQTYEKLEFLIVDDCGTDNSIDIIRNLVASHTRGNCIKILKQSHNMGPGEGRNRAIKEASGDFIYFIDSDDFIEPETISIMVEQAESHGADVVIATMRSVDYETGMITPAFTYSKLEVVSGHDAFAHKVCSNLHWNIGITSCNTLFSLVFLRKNKLLFAAKKDEDALFLSDYYSEVECAVLMPDITYNYLSRRGSIMGAQARNNIPINEIRERFRTDVLMTERCRRLKCRSFYDVHCSRVMKHKFRAVCVALRHRSKFTDYLSDLEIRQEIKHPATFKEIMTFKRYRCFNLLFYILGILPPSFSVKLSYFIGKVIRWI